MFDQALHISKIEFRDDGDFVIPEQIEGKPDKVPYFAVLLIGDHYRGVNRVFLT
jgi:hypothetical protein